LQNYYLLVDDDFDDALVFADVLKEVDAHMRFEHASNGMEALELLSKRASHLPDMIFLDLNMPRMNGKECLREIKANGNYKHIPVIIYTTSSLSADIEETFIMGATCFVTKPTSVKELKKILSTIRFASGPDLVKRCATLQE
jgi:CheY-like chemotaxis protein